MPLPSLNSIVGLATNKPLSDASLPSNPVSLKLPDQSAQIDMPDPSNAAPPVGSFNLGIGAAVSIAIINSDSDPDPYGFFNLGSSPEKCAEDPTDAPLKETPAVYDASLAYVIVTGLSVSGKIPGKFTIGGNVSGLVDGSASLDVTSCCAFPRTTPVWDAVNGAVSGFPNIFSLGDLRTPSPAVEAAAPAYTWRVLSFGAQGSLSASLKITAASLASTVSESLNAVLGSVGPVKFDWNPGATVTISASVDDGYRVFASRTAGGVRFCVKKSESSSLGLDGGLGLELTLSLSDLNDTVNSAIEQLTNVPAGTLRSILGKTIGTLSSDLQALLAKILAKLDVPSTTTELLTALQKKIDAVKEEVGNRLSLVVKAQFCYQWKRLTSDELVARFTVPDAALPKYHASILALELHTLMDAPAEDGIVFERFLGRKAVEIDVGCGFSFAIGDFVFLKSWDSLQTKFVELDTVTIAGSRLRQFSFLGKRGYDAQWLSSSHSNYVELDASMPMPLAAPTAADFTTALSVTFSWSHQRFSDLLSTIADHGVIIAAFDSDDVDEAKASLLAAGLSTNATGDAVVCLKIGDFALRRLLPTLTGDAYLTQIAPNALARALPYVADFPERSQVDRRMSVYGQVWANFLATDDVSSGTLGRLTQLALDRRGDITRNLTANENAPASNWSVARVGAMEGEDSLQDAIVNSAPNAFGLLRQRVGDFHSVFPQCVANLGALGEDPFRCRVLASMLLLAAELSPGGLSAISRSVQFSWKDDTGDHAVAVTPGSSVVP